MGLEQERATAIRLIEQVKALGHDDESLLMTTVEGETNLLECIDAIMLSSFQDEEYAAAIGRMIDELSIRQKRLSARSNSKRHMVFAVMQDIGAKKIDRPAFSLTISAGKRKVIIMDDALLPSQYVKTHRTPDKAAISTALTAGTHVDGAILSNAEPFMTVRTK